MLIIDKFGLNESELAHIEAKVEEMDFDFIRFADKVEVTIKPHAPCGGEMWHPEFDVLIEGSSDDDQRGNGYFGYSSKRSLLQGEIED